MAITAQQVKELREKTGAGVMDCKAALAEMNGDVEKAIEHLRKSGVLKAAKKADRPTGEGIISSYVHAGAKLAVLVEINCETDFVARTDEFKELAHNIAMQVAAICPQCISREDFNLEENEDTNPEQACLLLQPYIREPEKTIQNLINETVAKVGENIKVSRFARFELGC